MSFYVPESIASPNSRNNASSTMNNNNIQTQTRVLQLISSCGFFGAENVLFQLAAEMKSCNSIFPAVGALENLDNPHIEIIKECQKKGIETVTFTCNGKIDLRTVFSIRKYIQTHNINVVHSHGYKSNLYSFFATRGLPIRLVSTCHNWLGDDLKMKGYAKLDRIILRRFDNVVAVSEDVRQKAIESGISPEKVHIVNNGISIEQFDSIDTHDEIRKDLGIGNECVVIGTVGRLSAEKGHGIFLNVAEQILVNYPHLVFLIVGDGPLRQQLENEFSSPSIIFTGLRRDLPDIYRLMDIFVLPSLTEGLPMVILEAMASRIPIIATRVGAIPTLIDNKETGLLIQPGNEEDLKVTLLSLLADPKMGERMAEKAFWKVKDNFSSGIMARNYISFYN